MWQLFVHLLIPTSVDGAAREAGTAAEVATSYNEEIYADLRGCYAFMPIAIKNLISSADL